jgi:thermostable 8-oxoguanine DNA glycosylase
MIDPTTITNFNRTEEELEEFLMFAILVAGKTAKTQAKKLKEFLSSKKLLGLPSDTTPFEFLEYLIKGNILTSLMMKCKLGQYKRLLIAFLGIVRFKGNLKNVTIDELESISGIGSKTARFFLLHSRKDAQFAVLDTHILKWLREQGHDAPKATPTKKKYTVLEKIFLTEASKREMLPADLDLQIWKSYATKA